MIYPLSFILGLFAHSLFQYFPYLTAALALAALFVLSKRKLLLPSVLLLVGVLYPVFHAAFIAGPVPKARTATLDGRFVSSPVKLEGGYSQDFSPTGKWSGLGAVSVLSGREFEAGREYKLLVRLVRPPVRQNPGAREREPYAVLKKVKGAGEPSGGVAARMGRTRERLNGFIRGGMGAEEAAFVMSQTTGERASLGRELNNAFSITGLAHLLSISGTHFGLFAFIVFWFFRTLVRRLPAPLLERLTVHLATSAAAAIITLPFLLCYLGVSGGSVPAVRSFIMVGLFLLGLLIVRRGHWLNFLLVAALLILLWDPESFKGLSFQLSFTAVLFIGFFMIGAGGVEGPFRWAERPEQQTVDSRPPWHGKLLGRVFVGPFLVSLSATLGVAPLVAYHFHYFSIISPMANLVVTPLVGFVLVPLSLLGSFVYLLTGSALLAPAMEAVSGLSLHLVKGFASVPYASVRVAPFPAALVVFYYLGLALYWASGKKRLLAVSVAPMLVYAAVSLLSPPALSVTFLDAGNANSSVVELPDGRVLVVDAGRTGKEAEEFLRYKGIKRIDALVVTHTHRDHSGGVRRLLRRFQVGEVWDNGRVYYPDGLLWEGLSHKGLNRGDVISGEGFRLTVLHPYPGFLTTSAARKYSSENNASLVFSLDAPGSGSVLFAGDVEDDAIRDIMALAGADVGKALRADLIKASRHGLRPYLGGALVEAVSPTHAVISSGALSRSQEGALKGREALLTGEGGAVKAEFRVGGLRVKAYRDSAIIKTGDALEEARNLKRLFAAW